MSSGTDTILPKTGFGDQKKCSTFGGSFGCVVWHSTAVTKPNLRDPVLRSELAKGKGHNTYGCDTTFDGVCEVAYTCIRRPLDCSTIRTHRHFDLGWRASGSICHTIGDTARVVPLAGLLDLACGAQQASWDQWHGSHSIRLGIGSLA